MSRRTRDSTAYLSHRPERKRKKAPVTFVAANDKKFQYTGRIDFSNPEKPKFSAPGGYVTASFKGTECEAIFNELGGDSHNFIEIAVDDRTPYRVQTTDVSNTFKIEGLSEGNHTVTFCKDTEASIGEIEFVGLRCQKLLSPPRLPKRKLEFYGDSITCGAWSDTSTKGCNEGKWYETNSAYEAYGPITARTLNARWQLVSASGIRLARRSDSTGRTLPDIYDKINLQKATGQWDFKKSQPDVVMICLGQNDGTSDPEGFRNTYIKFVSTLRGVYPKAQIVCLTSPMGSAELTTFLKENIAQVVDNARKNGDLKVSSYAFSRSYYKGCGGHPSLQEHKLIAAELSGYLKTTLGWK